MENEGIESQSIITQQIRKQAAQVIETLRHPNLNTEIGRHIKKYADPEVYSTYNPTFFMSLANDRYHIPLAFAEKPTSKTMRHETLLLKPPYQKGNNWYVLIYDPFIGRIEYPLKSYDSRSSQFIKPSPLSVGVGRIEKIEVGNNSWQIVLSRVLLNDLFSGRTYNLSRQMPSESIPLLQSPDNHTRCVPYSFYMAMRLNSVRTDLTPLEQSGIRQFENDFNLKPT